MTIDDQLIWREAGTSHRTGEHPHDFIYQPRRNYWKSSRNDHSL